MFDKFKEVHKDDGNWYKAFKETNSNFNDEMRDMFEDALHQLKYTGYVSATRQSTFLFKKNIFSKPKYYSLDVEAK